MATGPFYPYPKPIVQCRSDGRPYPRSPEIGDDLHLKAPVFDRNRFAGLLAAEVAGEIEVLLQNSTSAPCVLHHLCHIFLYACSIFLTRRDLLQSGLAAIR